MTSTAEDLGGNAPFTPIEREVIGRHLTAIEERTIKTNQLIGEEQQYVREQFAYLREAVDRVGRLDWKNLAFSTFLNIAVAVGMDPGKAHAMITMASQLLGPLVTGVGRFLASS